MKIRQKTYRKGSDLFGCYVCNIEIDNEKEAKQHCKKTGHKVWREYNTVTHYFTEGLEEGI